MMFRCVSIRLTFLGTDVLAYIAEEDHGSGAKPRVSPSPQIWDGGQHNVLLGWAPLSSESVSDEALDDDSKLRRTMILLVVP
jgi:hypothetical protein